MNVRYQGKLSHTQVIKFQSQRRPQNLGLGSPEITTSHVTARWEADACGWGRLNEKRCKHTSRPPVSYKSQSSSIHIIQSIIIAKMPKAAPRTNGPKASTNRSEPYTKISPKSSKANTNKENIDPTSKPSKKSKSQSGQKGDYRKWLCCIPYCSRLWWLSLLQSQYWGEKAS